VQRGNWREQKCGFSPKVKKTTFNFCERGNWREQKSGFSSKVKKPHY
jgi:hypothetical protein